MNQARVAERYAIYQHERSAGAAGSDASKSHTLRLGIEVWARKGAARPLMASDIAIVHIPRVLPAKGSSPI